jgi:hypothetical protein
LGGGAWSCLAVEEVAVLGWGQSTEKWPKKATTKEEASNNNSNSNSNSYNPVAAGARPAVLRVAACATWPLPVALVQQREVVREVLAQCVHARAQLAQLRPQGRHSRV